MVAERSKNGHLNRALRKAQVSALYGLILVQPVSVSSTFTFINRKCQVSTKTYLGFIKRNVFQMKIKQLFLNRWSADFLYGWDQDFGLYSCNFLSYQFLVNSSQVQITDAPRLTHLGHLILDGLQRGNDQSTALENTWNINRETPEGNNTFCKKYRGQLCQGLSTPSWTSMLRKFCEQWHFER